MQSEAERKSKIEVDLSVVSFRDREVVMDQLFGPSELDADEIDSRTMSSCLAVNDCFGLEEFSECDFTPFASVAGQLIAALDPRRRHQ